MNSYILIPKVIIIIILSDSIHTFRLQKLIFLEGDNDLSIITVKDLAEGK